MIGKLVKYYYYDVIGIGIVLPSDDSPKYYDIHWITGFDAGNKILHYSSKWVKENLA